MATAPGVVRAPLVENLHAVDSTSYANLQPCRLPHPSLPLATSHHSASSSRSALLVVPLVPLVGVIARRRKQRRSVARRANKPYPSGVYDFPASVEYFNTRPLQVIGRSVELASALLGFGAGLFIDKQTGQLDSNMKNRAKECTDVITGLGPTFIKIGQALSIRADLLPPAYLIALMELQDRVPPVPNELADQIVEKELGQPVLQIFEDISKAPIASASLGQVYRAKLIDGRDVAVKVQRPGMEEVVALDLFLLRSGAPTMKWILGLTFGALNTDLVGLVDVWGEGFVGELDYVEEARNATEFNVKIKETQLGLTVCAPTVVDEYTSGKVLVTEWIDGERLELSKGKDVTKLCSVAMNTYLTMLLQTGTLHADPHPGNLLRMKDGRLCILDWGLVTSMDQDIQFTFIEHIAHLVARDYAKLPSDLTKLGFVPEGKEEDIAASEVVDVLSNVYSQWTDGGGATKVDVNKFLGELQGLSAKYGSIFRVPPYFFYIARAFAVLEGIGLSNDEGYSIVAECLPYVSQRLLTDSSPRAAGALETYIYGDEKGSPDRTIQVQKIEYLVDGMSNYSSSTEGLLERPSLTVRTEQMVDQLAELIIGDGQDPDAKPTALQQIILDELAKVAGAGARSTIANTLGIEKQPEGSLKAFTPDDKDKRTLESAQQLVDMGAPQAQQLVEDFRALELEEQVKVSTTVLSKIWEYRGGAAAAGGRLLRQVFSQSLQRAAKELRPSKP